MSVVKELQADDWESEVMKAESPVVVDFWHDMCGWCLKLNPIYEELPERFDNVKFGKINVLTSVENRSIAIKHGVMGTPTIKVFCQGRDIGEIIGFRNRDELIKDIEDILAKREDCLSHSSPLE
jgi:thioredoxin 1